jgi:hypothetical protein
MASVQLSLLLFEVVFYFSLEVVSLHGGKTPDALSEA